MAEDQSKPQGDGASRRSLLKIGVGVVGGGVALLPLAPALGFVWHPLSNDVTSSGGGFILAGKRGDFGAEPVRVDLYADQVDAWTRSRDVKIGSAWVVEVDGELTAFSTVCPHLGCSIDYSPDSKKFICPCHKSFFSIDGKVEEGPSPRSLDSLDIQMEGDDKKQDKKLVSIRYCRFKQGVESKEELG